MIYESSKNYLDNTVLMLFDGAAPTVDEINEHCLKNYGSVPVFFSIYELSEFRGYVNTGTVKGLFSN